MRLMEHFPFLGTAAFIVIGILGLKLMLSLYKHFAPESVRSKFLMNHTADIGISILTGSVFFVPMLTSRFFNFPRRHTVEDKKGV